MQKVLDEVIEKIATLTEGELNKVKEAVKEQENKAKPETKKGYVSPDTIWIKENHAKYAGLHVAIKDGELIATGRTIKETNEKAKAKGVDEPLLHYIPAKGEEVWGGW